MKEIRAKLFEFRNDPDIINKVQEMTQESSINKNFIKDSLQTLDALTLKDYDYQDFYL